MLTMLLLLMLHDGLRACAEHYHLLGGVRVDLLAGAADGVIPPAAVRHHLPYLVAAGVPHSFKILPCGHLDLTFAVWGGGVNVDHRVLRCVLCAADVAHTPTPVCAGQRRDPGVCHRQADVPVVMLPVNYSLAEKGATNKRYLLVYRVREKQGIS